MRKELIDTYKSLIEANITCTFYNGIPPYDHVITKGNYPAIGVAGGDERTSKEGRRDIHYIDVVIMGFAGSDDEKETLIEDIYTLLEANPYDYDEQDVKHVAKVDTINIYTDELYQLMFEKITLFKMIATFKMWTKSNQR